MKNFLLLNKSEILEEYSKLLGVYEDFKRKNIKLDMSRGKPGISQLDLSLGLLDSVHSKSDFVVRGEIDVRNYGACDGLEEIKDLISEVTGVNKDYFIVGGNSSLSMMFDAISFFMIHGSCGCEPWCKQKKIKFLCPSPGYDRHFRITEYFGMELVMIPMNSDGPDMDMIEQIVNKDASIKGIWCVPKYSNPGGITYSDEVVRRFANLKPAAPDFKIFWDNAYFAHDLTPNTVPLLDIVEECLKLNKQEMPILFYSTSKITFPGSGIAFMACMGRNLENFKKMYSVKTVGFDKINQLRHVKFLKDKVNFFNHMKKHREILKPKFDTILNCLNLEFGKNPILTWNIPQGGYFISVNTFSGCAKRTVQLCKEAGVNLTDAGASFPYGRDPEDSNIRLAPTFPSLNELECAIQLFCICVKLAFLEKNLD